MRQMTDCGTSRITFVLPDLSRGGAQRVALTLMNLSVRKGLAVTLLLVGDRRDELDDIDPEINVVRLGKNRLLRAVPELYRTLQRQKPDAIFSTIGYVNLALLFLRPFLTFDHRLVVREANLPSAIFAKAKVPTFTRTLYQSLYRRADFIFVTSEKMQQEFSDLQLARSEQLCLFYNPVDVDKILKNATGEAPFPNRGNTLKKVVLSGRMVEQKGFDRFVETLPDLSSELEFHFLGDGPQKEKLVQRVSQLGQSHRVKFHGQVSNPWAYYKAADIFAMPSRWEGMPNALLEALVCGLHCVATPESGGVEDIRKLMSKPEQLTIADFDKDFTASLNHLASKQGKTEDGIYLPQSFSLENAFTRFQQKIMS
ncbi:glycosyltransferase [Kiloniella sp. b19]|uniref:glycosyltransferase n=1 Tax=Kiloniella sp. GXU_MW_B19 TaxID=3141326 RepID=UPI0031D7C710